MQNRQNKSVKGVRGINIGIGVGGEGVLFSGQYVDPYFCMDEAKFEAMKNWVKNNRS
jgi:hypothetical protein